MLKSAPFCCSKNRGATVTWEASTWRWRDAICASSCSSCGTKSGEVWRWIRVYSVCIYIYIQSALCTYSLYICEYIYIYIYIYTRNVCRMPYQYSEINFDQLGFTWCSSDVPMIMICPAQNGWEHVFNMKIHPFVVVHSFHCVAKTTR